MKNEKIRTCPFIPLPNLELPLYWTGIGEEVRTSSSYRWEGRSRGAGPELALLWQVTISGCGYLEIPSQSTVALPRGRSFFALLPSDHAYGFSPAQASHWHFAWIIWTGPAIAAFHRSLQLPDAAPFSISDDDTAVTRLRTWVKWYRKEGPDPWRNMDDSLWLLQALLRLRHTPSRQARKHKSFSIKTAPAGLEAAVNKKGWADSAGISRFQLYRSLKKSAGLAPGDFLRQRRLQAACHLLKSTGLPVGDVALQSGFTDANYFSRFFRQRTGQTPRAWRKAFGSA